MRVALSGKATRHNILKQERASLEDDPSPATSMTRTSLKVDIITLDNSRCSLEKENSLRPASQRERPSVVSKRELSVGKSFAIRSLHIPNSDSAQQESGSEAGDVIDLGAPRRVRRAPVSLPRAPRLYTPNPRLFVFKHFS
ncbi:unnamed protein product [Danaus chrysippus]|uniref:(African queen) hypothetical protein n=1 Tax=Danaus chrysippus TaxID=151541 RepID=A0A8J2R7A8_9NEOP|nr:unnamed protein product [Danaus chrysippus]